MFLCELRKLILCKEGAAMSMLSMAIENSKESIAVTTHHFAGFKHCHMRTKHCQRLGFVRLERQHQLLAQLLGAFLLLGPAALPLLSALLIPNSPCALARGVCSQAEEASQLLWCFSFCCMLASFCNTKRQKMGRESARAPSKV